MTEGSGTADHFELRPMGGADLEGVLELNQASTPEVGDLDAGRLAALVEMAELAIVAVPRAPGDAADVADAADPPGGRDRWGGPPGGRDRWGVQHGPAGFVIALGPGRDYGSPNYRFFDAGTPDFLYVDRIAVAPWAHRSGLGRALYGEVVAAARALGRGRVTCEVNVQPPNPGSLAFHAALGFEEVGRQWTYGDTVEVQLLELDVPPPRPVL